jgi:hypothetical protein
MNISMSVKYVALACACVGLFSSCAEAPPRQRRAPPVAVAPPPPPTPRVYFYPLQGQSAEQQDRDKYECYLWAKRQTGFDPSSAQVPSSRRVEVVPTAPPGRDTAVGAIGGAVVGAAVSRPRDAGAGALIGAAVGAIAGAVSDSSRQDEVNRVQERYDDRSAAAEARWEQQVNEYRRAMSTCLEGRGYSVQ